MKEKVIKTILFIVFTAIYPVLMAGRVVLWFYDEFFSDFYLFLSFFYEVSDDD